MDLLEFGMKYEKSRSKLLKDAAKAALLAERKKADLYESYLEQKQISTPEDEAQDAALLRQIKERIAQEEAEKEVQSASCADPDKKNTQCQEMP